MESVFEVIVEPNRRAILSLLVSSQQSVGEIERQLACRSRRCQSTASAARGRFRGVHGGRTAPSVPAEPEPFQELDIWLAQFRRFWSAHDGCS